MGWTWMIGRNGFRHLMDGDDYILTPESYLGDYGLSCIEWCDVSDEHARLIAAAPGLLKTLEDLRDWLALLAIADADDVFRSAPDRFDEIQAAIALATQPAKSQEGE